MSVFDNVPSTFPLEVDLTHRPVKYTLKSDMVDQIPSGILSLFWIFLGPFVIYMFMEPFLNDPQTQTMAWWIMVATCSSYLIWAVFFYFGPEILGLLRRVEIVITDDQVEVTEHILFYKNRWSDPIDHFEGVAMLNLGTQLVGDDKLPLASIILKHPDPQRSVPLVIRQKRQLGKKTIEKIAAQMGLPAVADVLDFSEKQNYPEDTIILNHFQALKVTVLYWLFLAAATLAFSIVGVQMASGALQPEMLLLMGLSLAVALPMHIYARSYVKELREQSDTIQITTASITRNRHTISKDEIRSITSYRGKLDNIKWRINTPFVNLRVNGRTLPFIIDMQSDYVVEKRLFALYRGDKRKNTKHK